jgi:hypothetical protein
MKKRAHVILLYLLVLSLPFYWIPAVNVRDFPATFAIQIDQVMMVLFVLTFLIYILNEWVDPVIELDSMIKYLLVFNIFIAVSSIAFLFQQGSSGAVDHFTTWAQLLLNSAFFVAVCSLPFNLRELHYILRIYMIVCLIVAALGVAQFILLNAFALGDLYVSSPSVEYATGRSGRFGVLGIYRATSIFIEARHFGNFLITPLFLGYGSLALDEFRIFDRRVTVACVVLFASGLLLSFSRSAYVVTAMGLCLIPFIVHRGQTKVAKVYFASAGFLTIFLILALLTGNASALESMLNQFILSEYMVNNLFNFDIQWFGVVRYIRGMYLAFVHTLENPLFGVGLNQTYSLIEFQLGLVTPPFALLMSIGLPGTIAFGAFLTTIATRTLSIRTQIGGNEFQRSLLTIATLFVILAVLKSVAGSRYNYPGTWFWIDLAIAGAIYYNIKRQLQQSVQSETTS